MAVPGMFCNKKLITAKVFWEGYTCQETLFAGSMGEKKMGQFTEALVIEYLNIYWASTIQLQALGT